MYRTLYLFKTSDGYLTNDNTFTNDPHEAIALVDEATARKKLAQASEVLTQSVSICPVQIQFPKPIKR